MTNIILLEEHQESSKMMIVSKKSYLSNPILGSVPYHPLRQLKNDIADTTQLNYYSTQLNSTTQLAFWANLL